MWYPVMQVTDNGGLQLGVYELINRMAWQFLLLHVVKLTEITIWSVFQ